jgi:two-component system chemotaxis sensor kinase CheA
MSEKQIHQFIFKPGFSTAQQVTSVSGRGVGMDVVKTNLDRIGGSTEIRSVEGQGSIFTIKIPLTLAIVSALIVACSGERFAIPQISVLELVRVSARSEYQIERIKGAPVLRLRQQLLPLIPLRDILHLQRDPQATGADQAECFVIVVQVGTAVFGIMVDRVFDTEEIVVKPVAPILRNVSLFSGNTILGDGSVIMILDPNGLAGAVGQSGSHDATAGDIVARSGGEEKTTLLLFRGADGAHRAVPLGLVARLEEVDRAKIERSAGGLTVQYRGRLMPLVPVDMGYDPPAEGRQPVLVFADGERSMGLMVEQIVDIVEEKLTVELLSTRPACLGSAILGGRATDVIDTEYYLRQAFDDWLGPRPTLRNGEMKRRVLLVDDSPFFRNLLTPLLSASGYQVTTVESADKALALHERGEIFDVILSDIEMPGTDGFAFADAVRRSQHWADKPLLALSASMPDDAAERGVFDSYVTKNDREGLLASLNQALHPLKGAA